MSTYLSPKGFSKLIGLSYDQVLRMCKLGELPAIRSKGGHYKIPRMELEKLNGDIDNKFVTLERYEEVVRENERLKLKLEMIRDMLDN